MPKIMAFIYSMYNIYSILQYLHDELVAVVADDVCVEMIQSLL